MKETIHTFENQAVFRWLVPRLCNELRSQIRLVFDGCQERYQGFISDVQNSVRRFEMTLHRLAKREVQVRKMVADLQVQLQEEQAEE